MSQSIVIIGSVVLVITFSLGFSYHIIKTRRRRKNILTAVIGDIFSEAKITYRYHSGFGRGTQGAIDPAGLTCQVEEKRFSFSIARRGAGKASTTISREVTLPVAVMILPVASKDFVALKRVAGFMGLTVFPHLAGKFGALARSHEDIDRLKGLSSWQDLVSIIETDPKLNMVHFLGSSDGVFSKFYAACGGEGIAVVRAGECAGEDAPMMKRYCTLLEDIGDEVVVS
ncbi:hypothetical protein MRY87_00010 [bacterium]|nr:hypothetical protein [bacterium]